MNNDWNAYLTAQGIGAGWQAFGALADELHAARDGDIVAPLADFGLLRASGEDATNFLHNLLTNDVKSLDAQSARFAGFCTPKGRLLATMHLWKEGEDILLMMPADILAAMHKKLSMYVLRSKVKLTDISNERVLIGIACASAASPAPSFAADHHDMPVPSAADAPGGKLIRLDACRWVLALAPEAAMGMWPGLAKMARPTGVAAWQYREILAGQPRVCAATQEAFVPQMLNMELPAVAGVSFTKGCYPGQEIVARTQYLGKVKRRLFRTALNVETTAGTPLFAPGADDPHCGAVVSVAPAAEGGYQALVCAQIGAVEAGDVRLGASDGPQLTFLSLPYPQEI